ncbi:HD domain-containing phosphohydrolase [Desulfocicer niacini]
MNRRILIVDDEQNLLNSLKRQLRKHFHIETALGPEQGLNCIKTQPPFAVIVSDLRMPVMDGIEFLAQAAKLKPHSVRIMLTGNADLQNAIKAVNEGNIYRFLTKPCAIELLANVLNQAVEQYRLITAEKELLNQTLKGSIKVMSELLSLVNPEALGRSSRIRRYATDISKQLGISNLWLIETAAMLSQIGCVLLPEETIKKLYQGQQLTPDESQLFDMHPGIAANLITKIPRMQPVADIIAFQDKRFDGSDQPEGARKGKDLPLGARILKVILDFDMLESKGFRQDKALAQLKKQWKWYDPSILKALEIFLGGKRRYIEKKIPLTSLKAGMLLSEDITTSKGQLLISRGEEVSPILIKRLTNFASKTKIKEPICVSVSLNQPKVMKGGI